MRRNILNRFCILLAIVAIVGCKAKKTVVKPRVDSVAIKPENNTMTGKLASIKANQVNFATFSGKAKTKLDFNGNSNDVTLNIRIKKSNKIWVSVTAIAGIEVARALITPDSIQVINRLQGMYLNKPFSYLNAYAGKQVNYNTLEALLTGNAVPVFLDNMNGTFNNENGTTTLSGNIQELVYKLFLRADLKVSETDLSNASAAQSLKVTNNDYMQIDSYLMPTQISMNSVVNDKNISINLHYTKIELNKQLEYPFNIPSKYAAAN
jgi:hypothetical protein